MNKSTDELMKILESKKTYKEFWDEAVGELCFSSVAEYLEVLLSEKNLNKSEVIKKANLDKNYAYQIFSGKRTNPSRGKILMLAFGMGLTVAETRKLLKICGLPDLYPRSPQDSVIIFCLNNQMNLMQANEELEYYGQDILE